MTGTVNPAPVGRTGITTGFTVGISRHAIHRARCCPGSAAAFAGFVRPRTLAGRIFPAAGLTLAALRIGTGHKITAADAFVIIATVVRTFLVGRLYRRTLRRLSVAVFLAGFIIIALARSIFAVTGRADAVIRLGTGLCHVGVANTFLIIRTVSGTGIIAM